MPTLHWIGKEKVINHHRDVPYKVLEHEYRFEAKIPSREGLGGARLGVGSSAEGHPEPVDDGNKIIHGDNLEALKSLLPEYEGKVKCIYIDPPYNTGNEGWVYNDNVNDPKMKKWLGEVVGKESENLTRHDKWLCMMYPRLKLLHKLLVEDGSIWISIDDAEAYHLRSLLDEIFGSSKFIACNIWQKRYSRENRSATGDSHEYLFVYAKNPLVFKETRNKLALGEKQKKVYKNPNNDPKGLWRAISFSAQGFRPNQMYKITSPITGKVFTPPEGFCWKKVESEYEKLLNEGSIYFGKDGNAMPQRIQYLADIEGIAPWTWWLHEEVGHTDESRKMIQQIFGSQTAFDTPKPVRLIERVIHIATKSGDIILDSFAGSGTTAHAVLNLNKQDGGNRKFILVEMEDYAETVTAERVRRVMNGYPSTSSGSTSSGGQKVVEGTGGSFDYYTLGQPIFLSDELLNEAIGIDKIREYVWYSETQLSIDNEQLKVDNAHFLGEANDTAYYFYYKKDQITSLDEAFMRTIQTRAEQYIIYADKCLLEEGLMQKYHIIFKKIPRDITRF